jgi:phosphoglycolate phosphatase
LRWDEDVDGKELNERVAVADGSQGKRLEAIIFDFDGTLAELHLDFVEMKRRLKTLAEEYFSYVALPATMPALEWLETLVVSLQESDEAAALDLEERAGLLIKEIELDAARRGALFPFTRAILDELQKACIKVAIITRNCEEAVRIVFPDLDRYCDGFLARNHVARVKPDPDHILCALEKIGASRETALMVGDHPLDMQAGHRLGILTAGVWSGNASPEDLLRSGADMIARNCQELMLELKEHRLL